MTRLWTFSDLHQEWDDNAWDPSRHVPADGFDAIVVAGDVATPLTASLAWLADRFAGARLVYVPGNHDFYWDRGDDRYTIQDQIHRGRDLAARLGIDLLIDGQAVIGSARFIGGTLWTDLRFGSYSLTHAARTARRGMYDYRRIRRLSSGHHRYVRAQDLLDRHRASRAFIAGALAQPHDGPTIVVTHHAPHPQSLSNPYMDLRWCYVSDLTDVIETGRLDLWVHGHLHNRSDYRVAGTRIVCNPRGHIEEPSCRAFDPSLVVEVTSGAVDVS